LINFFYVKPVLKCRQSVEVGRAKDVSGEHIISVFRIGVCWECMHLCRQMVHSDSGSRRVRFGAVKKRHEKPLEKYPFGKPIMLFFCMGVRDGLSIKSLKWPSIFLKEGH